MARVATTLLLLLPHISPLLTLPTTAIAEKGWSYRGKGGVLSPWGEREAPEEEQLNLPGLPEVFRMLEMSRTPEVSRLSRMSDISTMSESSKGSGSYNLQPVFLNMPPVVRQRAPREPGQGGGHYLQLPNMLPVFRKRDPGQGGDPYLQLPGLPFSTLLPSAPRRRRRPSAQRARLVRIWQDG